MKKETRKTNNFYLKSDDLKAVAALLNKGDAVVFPCTIVIAPNGKITYHKELAVDAVELRRGIVTGIEGLGE